MRVLLTGRPKDRDRVRPELLEAGIEIVGESDAAPGAASAPHSVDAIVTATDASRNGGRIIRPGAIDGGRAFRPGDTEVESLTAREQEVLALLAEGLPNKAIAHALGISDQTVKFHVAAIIGKLGATNRTDAVRRAIRRGLVAI
jgi:DNA-binding NarL/FixJ family response regulator